MSSLWAQMRFLNPYEIHKLLINDYVLKRPGDTTFLKRDTSKDKNDLDVIRENHKFLWNEDDKTDSWELQFAKRYYDKLFKEYCIADLIFYKENKVALRWRTEKEVIIGKGQFICGNKRCSDKEGLKTWEVNFAYIEQGSKKNALVKIRLCPDCSKKLNYHSKKKEIKRLKRARHKSPITTLTATNEIAESDKPTTSNSENLSDLDELNSDKVINGTQTTKKTENNCDEQSLWENHKHEEPKSREEEMEEYLQDLLL